MEYHAIITPQMREVNSTLVERCEGINHCVHILNRNNIVVEVPKCDVESVVSVLKASFPDVVDIRKAYQMIDDLHDFIFVKPLISEAPLIDEGGIPSASIEKILVDSVSDREYNRAGLPSSTKLFQKAFEQYPVNTSKMLRYASRKGKKNEVGALLGGLDMGRIGTVSALCKVLSNAPVLKAWVFGSFARMEERPDSDIDILVSLDNSTPIGLMGYASLVEELENAANRKVDLVAEGSLKLFAQESVNRDKYLVYERAAAR